MLELRPDIQDLPIVEVATDALLPGYSPRLEGEDEENVRRLAELDQPLTPLLVQRDTNRVIDGMHRLEAARRRGRRTVAVQLCDCDEANAFVLAVSSNAAHGLPLSIADRKAAAARILGTHPHWSDRRIAMVTGISDKTVAALRGRTLPRDPAPAAPRVGLDGRVRPLDRANRRIEVTRLLAAHPEAPLRRIAERAGVSPETVRKIKHALRSEGGGDGEERCPAAPVRDPARGARLDPIQCLYMLAKDPVLRLTDPGRTLLRALSSFPLIARDADRLLESVPEHDLLVFSRLAEANAVVWQRLADDAGRRARGAEQTPAAAA